MRPLPVKMVHIRPFRGIHYDPARFPDLSPVIAPPYDVITPELAHRLQKRCRFNISSLTAPGEGESGTDGDRYRRVALTWRLWKRKGIVVKQDRPAVWRVHETFPFSGGMVTRTGFVAVLRLEEYSPDGVRRHERIHREARQDRLAHLEKTGLNPGPLLFVYPGSPSGTAFLEKSFVPDFETRAVGPGDDDVRLHISYTTDGKWIERFRAQVQPGPVIIADGHHRYEASLALHRKRGSDPSVDAGWVLGHFLPASSEGVVVHPVHRAVRQVDRLDFSECKSRLSRFFDMVPGDGVDRSQSPVIFVYGIRDPLTLIPKGETLRRLEKEVIPPHSASLSPLLVDNIILNLVLELPRSEIARQKILSYFHDRKACMKAVRRGEFQMAFLVKPVSVEDLFSVTDRGGVFPQKSTYFYPKCPDGVVMHSLAVS